MRAAQPCDGRHASSHGSAFVPARSSASMQDAHRGSSWAPASGSASGGLHVSFSQPCHRRGQAQSEHVHHAHLHVSPLRWSQSHSCLQGHAPPSATQPQPPPSLKAAGSQSGLPSLWRSLQTAVPGTLPAPLEDTSAPAAFMARAAEAWQALAVRLGSLRWRLQRQVSQHSCPT